MCCRESLRKLYTKFMLILFIIDSFKSHLIVTMDDCFGQMSSSIDLSSFELYTYRTITDLQNYE